MRKTFLALLLAGAVTAPFTQDVFAQEKNFDLEDAAKTWDRLVARFPRDTGMLGHAVEFQMRWGSPQRWGGPAWGSRNSRPRMGNGTPNIFNAVASRTRRSSHRPQFST